MKTVPRIIRIFVFLISGLSGISQYAFSSTRPDFTLPYLGSDIISFPSEDTIFSIPEVLNQIIENDERDQLFNECAYCEQDRREWYYSLDTFKHMAYVCGFDFIQIRFSRKYISNSDTSYANYYISVFPNQIICDSVVYYYTDNEKARKITIPDILISSDSKSLFLDINHSISVDDIDTIVSYAQTFTSQEIIHKENNNLERALVFSLGDRYFCLAENGSVTSCYPQEKGGDDGLGRAAYRLGTFDKTAFRKSGFLQDHSLLPVLENLQIFYHYGILTVGVNATSTYGIHEVTFKTENVAKEIFVTNNKQFNTIVPLECTSSDSTLTVSVTDKYGNSIERSVPIYKEHHEMIARIKRQKEIQRMKEIWSNKNIFTKALTFINKFSFTLGPTPLGNIAEKVCQKKSLKYVQDKYGFNAISLEEADLKDPRLADENGVSIPYPIRYSAIFPGDIEKDSRTGHYSVIYAIPNTGQSMNSCANFSVTFPGINQTGTIRIDTPDDSVRKDCHEEPYSLFIAGDSVVTSDSSITLSCFPPKVSSVNESLRFNTVYATNVNTVFDTLIYYAVIHRKGDKSKKVFSFSLPTNTQQSHESFISTNECIGSVYDRFVHQDTESTVCVVSTFDISLQREWESVTQLDLFLFSCKKKRWVGATSAVMRHVAMKQ